MSTAPPLPSPLADDAAHWQPLPARAATLAAISAAISTLIPVTVTGVLAVAGSRAGRGDPLLMVLVAVAGLLLVGLAAWLAARRSRRTRWRLDDNAFGVQRARLWASDTRVPRARVQHLDIQRGPLQRRAGLATLVVHTAGSQLPALRLRGLDHADAERLRDLLARPQDHDGL